MSDLHQPLTIVKGTALMLNIVIGAGLLALPGLAIEQAGSQAFYSWVFCAAVSLPLLLVFAILGQNHPNAGGISHFAKLAFGLPGYGAASLIFLGAVIFGLPSIALTGGYYAAALIDISPHLAAMGLIGLAMLLQLISSELVAKTNTFLSAVILITVFALVAFGLYFIQASPDGAGIAPLTDIQTSIAFVPFMMLFFAFTGWEVAAGLSEEFHNPRRDFPIAMAASFVITIALYLSLAYLAAQVSLTDGYEVAFITIAVSAIGPVGRHIIAILAVIIILANLSGAIWAVSRLIFSLSREGFLPSVFRSTYEGTPRLAVFITSLALILVATADWLGFLGLHYMLTLSGQNFIALFGIASAALLMVTDQITTKCLAGLVILLVLLLISMQGAIAIYPLILTLVGLGLGNHHHTRVTQN